jgi:hypothetical protein|tara:strand:- start:2133 stop:2960 length:828 start_codon:yes stop_codon:yes gene_type:complete
MKIKHNKKRNTAFVYEALVREATVAILKEDVERKEKAVSIIKKHFHSQSILKQDLECYRSLYENQSLDEKTSQKILNEVRMQKHMIDPTGLFKQQTELIHDINKELTPEVFNNFVPNYKALATIDQMFSVKTSPKNRVILEGEIVKGMTIAVDDTQASAIDNITFRTFVGKFNDKYGDGLLQEQKDLLTRYITSFSDNNLELKIYLNNEISRLKGKLSEAVNVQEIKNDKEMIGKTNKILDRLSSFAKETINENVLMTVLKTQSLVEEIYNGNND